jgi:hypothetical protein
MKDQFWVSIDGQTFRACGEIDGTAAIFESIGSYSDHDDSDILCQRWSRKFGPVVKVDLRHPSMRSAPSRQ